MDQESGVEVDKKGGTIKSIDSTQKSFLTFFNASRRNVDVIWLNYRGQPVLYKTLRPGQFFDVDTFVTHPWVFRDSDSHDTLIADCKEIYLPPPWSGVCERYVRRNNRVFGIPQRIHVHITIPVYSLLQRAMQIIRNNLLDSVIQESLQNVDSQRSIDSLGLPRTLEKELVVFLKKSFYNPTE